MSLILPLLLFIVAAVGGSMMTFSYFRDRAPPWWLSLLHGVFAAGGIIALFSAFLSDWNLLRVSVFALLAAAASTGFVLAFLHLRDMRPSPLLLGAHIVSAVTGLGMLAGESAALF